MIDVARLKEPPGFPTMLSEFGPSRACYAGCWILVRNKREFSALVAYQLWQQLPKLVQ